MSEHPIFSDNNLKTMSEPSLTSHWILWTGIAFFVVFVFWACLAILDEVTTGEGKIIPSSKVQIIQNLEGGIVGKISVKEGEKVEKGQVVMIIDDTRFASSYNESLQRADALQAKVYRLIAETQDKPFEVPKEFSTKNPKLVANERNLYDSRKNELTTKIRTLQEQVEQHQNELSELLAKQETLKRSYDLLMKELNLTKPLLKSGAVSEVEVIRLERQTNDLHGELENSKLSIPRLQASINQAKSAIDEQKASNRTQALDDLNKSRAELDPLLENIKGLADRVKRTEVRSPVKGTVKEIKVSTIGGVVQPGMDLMEIVPSDGTLLVEAHIRPRDIGFLRPDQDATVKITAYDFSIYGGLKGKVELISADSIKNERDESFYKIYIRTDKNYILHGDKKLEIIPGMLATVDVLTGHKTVMNYLLKPILKTKEAALKER